MTLPVTVQNRSLDVPSVGHRLPLQAACAGGTFGTVAGLAADQTAGPAPPPTVCATTRRPSQLGLSGEEVVQQGFVVVGLTDRGGAVQGASNRAPAEPVLRPERVWCLSGCAGGVRGCGGQGRRSGSGDSRSPRGARRGRCFRLRAVGPNEQHQAVPVANLGASGHRRRRADRTAQFLAGLRFGAGGNRVSGFAETKGQPSGFAE